jgi:hypothetical protein
MMMQCVGNLTVPGKKKTMPCLQVAEAIVKAHITANRESMDLRKSTGRGDARMFQVKTYLCSLT